MHLQGQREDSALQRTDRRKKSGCWVAAALGAAVLWAVEALRDQVVQDLARRPLDAAGDLGYGLLSLAVGLGLLVGGPIYMARVNRHRLAHGRKATYGALEKSIVFVGGVVFVSFGLSLLLGVFR